MTEQQIRDAAAKRGAEQKRDEQPRESAGASGGLVTREADRG